MSPRIGGLEQKLLLSTITWNTAIGPTGGSWETGSNWVGCQVPGSTDDAVIDLAGYSGPQKVDHSGHVHLLRVSRVQPLVTSPR